MISRLRQTHTHTHTNHTHTAHTHTHTLKHKGTHARTHIHTPTHTKENIFQVAGLEHHVWAERLPSRIPVVGNTGVARPPLAQFKLPSDPSLTPTPQGPCASGILPLPLAHARMCFCFACVCVPDVVIECEATLNCPTVSQRDIWKS